MIICILFVVKKKDKQKGSPKASHRLCNYKKKFITKQLSCKNGLAQCDGRYMAEN